MTTNRKGDMPAFPQSVAVGPAGDVYSSLDVSDANGLSKREAFAMAALTGFVAGTSGNEGSMRGAMESASSNGISISEHFAKSAIAIANALIAALEREEGK